MMLVTTLGIIENLRHLILNFITFSFYISSPLFLVLRISFQKFLLQVLLYRGRGQRDVSPFKNKFPLSLTKYPKERGIKGVRSPWNTKSEVYTESP